MPSTTRLFVLSIRARPHAGRQYLGTELGDSRKGKAREGTGGRCLMAVSCSKGSRRAVLVCSPFAKEKCPAKHGTATDVPATGAPFCNRRSSRAYYVPPKKVSMLTPICCFLVLGTCPYPYKTNCTPSISTHTHGRRQRPSARDHRDGEAGRKAGVDPNGALRCQPQGLSDGERHQRVPVRHALDQLQGEAVVRVSAIEK